MANWIKTCTNQVNVFAVGPSTKWGSAVVAQTMVWGTAKWGEGTNPQAFIVSKLIANSLAPTWDKYSVRFSKVFEIGSAAMSWDMSLETLMSGQWHIVFTSDTINTADRDFASWTSATLPDATFTCHAANGTTWSEL